MMDVMEDREVRRLNLELPQLPHNPDGKAGNEERRTFLTQNKIIIYLPIDLIKRTALLLF